MTTRRTFLATLASAPVLGVAGVVTPPATGHAARYWHAGERGMVVCDLCPHGCSLQQGETGNCRVRQNSGGTLVTHGYGNPCAVHVDPIEKKPLYHVLPGAKSFSIAVAGCNFRCLNCQNYTISQVSPLQTRNADLPPHLVVEQASKSGCKTIAYTYSEPTVWYEYMYDTAVLARKAGLKNLLITCGYINEKPLAELATVMDAANIDLKCFDARTHQRLNIGKLDAVLDTLVRARKLGIWVEVTNLVIPDWTDDLDVIRKMCAWLVQNMGADTPLHFSRFQPMHMLAHLAPTPSEVLTQARDVAVAAGIRYVYIGNVADADSNTYCPSCRKVLVSRNGFWVSGTEVVNGACRYCGAKVPGIWT
jgi:pyruvate formate lyase activating enzyme